MWSSLRVIVAVTMVGLLGATGCASQESADTSDQQKASASEASSESRSDRVSERPEESDGELHRDLKLDRSDASELGSAFLETLASSSVADTWKTRAQGDAGQRATVASHPPENRTDYNVGGAVGSAIQYLETRLVNDFPVAVVDPSVSPREITPDYVLTGVVSIAEGPTDGGRMTWRVELKIVETGSEKTVLSEAYRIEKKTGSDAANSEQ